MAIIARCYGNPWAHRRIHTLFSEKLDANVHAARSAPKSETAADVTN